MKYYCYTLFSLHSTLLVERNQLKKQIHIDMQCLNVFCLSTAGSYVVSSSKVLSESSKAQCYTEGYTPANVLGIWDYFGIQKVISADSPHWMSSVSPPGKHDMYLRCNL